MSQNILYTGFETYRFFKRRGLPGNQQKRQYKCNMEKGSVKAATLLKRMQDAPGIRICMFYISVVFRNFLF